MDHLNVFMLLVFAIEREYIYFHDEAKKKQRTSDICWPNTKIGFTLATMFFLYTF